MNMRTPSVFIVEPKPITAQDFIGAPITRHTLAEIDEIIERYKQESLDLGYESLDDRRLREEGFNFKVRDLIYLRQRIKDGFV